MIAFLDAVAHQVAHRLGGGGVDRSEADVRDAAERLLEWSRDDRREDAAHELAVDAVMLAAFFQNIDLLYSSDYTHSDAVALMLGRALEFSAEMKTP